MEEQGHKVKKAWYLDIFDNIVHAAINSYFKVRFRTTVHGQENLEKLEKLISEGKNTLLIANHVSMLDAAAIIAMLPKKLMPAFAIKKRTYNELMQKPLYRPFLERVDLFPIDEKDPRALRHLTKLAQTGKPVFIFPEGRLTRTSGLMKIYPGAGMVVDEANATVVPLHLEGFQFAPHGRKFLKFFPRKPFPKFSLTFGEPTEFDIPEDMKGKSRRAEQYKQLEKIVRELPLLSVHKDSHYIGELHKASKNFGGGKPILDYYDSPDATFHTSMTYNGVLTGAYAIGEALKKHTDEFKINEDGTMDGAVGLMIANGKASVSTLGLMAYNRVPAMLNPKENLDKLLSVAETAKLKTIVTSRTLVEMAGIEDKLEELRTKVPEGEEPRKIVYLEDLKSEIGIFTKIKSALRARGLWPRPAEQKRMEGSNPAVIYFTSGSTGNPKGVVLSHENILVNIAQARSVDNFTPNDAVFNAMPQFHAFGGTGGFMLPMLHGVQSLQYPNPLDSNTIPEAVYQYYATTMFGTDTFLNLYAKKATGKHFENLKNVFAGGERLKDETAKLYQDRYGVSINQGYGMTETAPLIAMNVKGDRKPATVGRFMPGVETKFTPVDGYDKGGILSVKARNVMLGYLKHENPGIVEPLKDGWLDTGDIVTVDDDGFARIVGRSKRLVIVGGENVELDEIENIALQAKPGFEYATIARPDPRKGETTVLFTTNPDMSRNVMVDFMKASGRKNTLGIPDASDIIVVDEIPKLAIGKADYPALQRMFAARANDDNPEAAKPEQTAPAAAGQGGPVIN